MSPSDSAQETARTQEDQIVSGSPGMKENKDNTPICYQAKDEKESQWEECSEKKNMPAFMNIEEKVCVFLKNPITRDFFFELVFEGGAKGLLELDNVRMITQKDNLPTKVWKFGRNGRKADFILPQLSRLSNLHFEIILERNRQFYIRDLSRNGTWINGNKIPFNMKMKAFDGDIVGLGYGIEDDCINYELEFNNTFMAQHRYLFLKNLENASKNNVELLSNRAFGNVGQLSRKRKSEKEEKGSNKKPKITDRSVVKVLDLPFISGKLQNPSKDLSTGLQRNGNPKVVNDGNSTGKANFHQLYRFFDTQLGQGAFAVVKKAERLTDKKLFAIKIISKAKLIGGALEGVESEMEVLRSINHERVVKLHDFYEDHESFYFVMDLVEGGDLMDFVAANGAVDENACCEIAFQILEAVNYMHDMNITHRDLKPDNILIEQDSPVLIKVTDFGLAKKGSALKTFCGTLAYIPPELIQDTVNSHQLKPRYLRPEYTTQVDMWSLGCLVYVIMTGHLPFSASSEEDLFIQIKSGEFHQGPLSMNKISAKGKDFLKALICTDPHERLTASQALKHSWFLENRKSLMEPSQNQEVSQMIALSQRPNKVQDNNKYIDKSEIENWKRDPIMDGSSQPWKRQKDPMNLPSVHNVFIPLLEKEKLTKVHVVDEDNLLITGGGNQSVAEKNHSLDVCQPFNGLKGRIQSIQQHNIARKGFFEKIILDNLSSTLPSDYYEVERDALLKLRNLKHATNSTPESKVLCINKDFFIIGRNNLADYTILDNTISKFHCMFAKIIDENDSTKFNWWLYCYSTNPMFVNDIKLTKYMKMKLFVGDAIKFVWNTSKNTYSGFYIPFMASHAGETELKNKGLLPNWIAWRNLVKNEPECRVTSKEATAIHLNKQMNNKFSASKEIALYDYEYTEIDKGNPQHLFPERELPKKMTEEEKLLYAHFLDRIVE